MYQTSLLLLLLHTLHTITITGGPKPIHTIYTPPAGRRRLHHPQTKNSP